MGTFKYHITLWVSGVCSNRQTGEGQGLWPNRHVTVIVAEKA